ncbi:MAG TPA: DUF4097 family beta strand repeat-containing protein [Terriglobales bacterium]|nr:DUF4097 family beta strand repeat-containing protein [Terriglobales bacterium]
MSTPCPCARCQFHRILAPLVLIGIGALLFAHMTFAAFDGPAMVGGLLLLIGVLQLVAYILPRPADGRHTLRGSIFVPLLLIAIGLLVLFRHSLPQASLAAWIAHYWPVLLILWGLTRLVEYFVQQPRGRSGMTGGEILVVVLICVFGLAFSGAYRFGHSRLANYWGVNVEGWNPFLQSFNYTAAANSPLAPGSSVLVKGYRGSVTLMPGASGVAHAAVNDTVHADGSDAAQRLFQSSQPAFVVDNGQLVVMPAGADEHGAVEADLTLTLPPATAVRVTLLHGDITVPNWGADLSLQATHGSITASHVTGNVTVASGHDSVSLDQITGNVSVSGSGDDVAISNVTGDTRLEGEFVGSLNFRNLPRGVHFNSSRTGLAIAALPGSLSYDMGRIAIRDAAGVSLRTRNESVEVEDFTGPIEVHTRNDSIRLSATAAPTGPITVTNQDSDVTLELPAASRLVVDANVRNGDVRNDFTNTPGGQPVSLSTTNGTITLRKRD